MASRFPCPSHWLLSHRRSQLEVTKGQLKTTQTALEEARQAKVNTVVPVCVLCGLLCAVCCVLCAVCCVLCAVCCVLCAERCALWALSSVLCAVGIGLFSVFCGLCAVGSDI